MKYLVVFTDIYERSIVLLKTFDNENDANIFADGVASVIDEDEGFAGVIVTE